MRFKVVGANKDSGDDVEAVLEAPTQTQAEELAAKRGILVSAVSALPKDESAIALIDDPPPSAHASGGHPAHSTGTHPAHATGAHPAHATGSHPAHATGAHPAHATGAHPAQASSAPVANGDPHGPAMAVEPESPAHAHGHITVSASNPADTAHTSEGTTPLVHHGDCSTEYHILLNQSLYLLESAVNKHLREGWEPAGGIAVGVSNNAMQYFQAMTRKKKQPS